MGNAKPRMSGEGIIDLSNDAAWQARLDEARARRAEALKKAGRSDAKPRQRVMPWEEGDAAPTPPAPTEKAGGVDFHDRINRFKKIAGVGPGREKSQEELARIDRLLWGPDVPSSANVEPEPTAMDARAPEIPAEPESPRADADPDLDGPINIFAETDAGDLRLPERAPMSPTPTSMMVAASRDAAARSLIADVGEAVDGADTPDRQQVSRLRLVFLATCIAITAGSAYVVATDTFVPALFWETTPPAMQTGVGPLPEVPPGAAASGVAPPGAFTEGPQDGTGWPPALATPAGYDIPSMARPAPRPWRTI